MLQRSRLIDSFIRREIEDRLFFEKIVSDDIDRFIHSCNIHNGENNRSLIHRFVAAREKIIKEEARGRSVYIISKKIQKQLTDVNMALNWYDRKMIKEGRDIIILTPYILTHPDEKWFWTNEEIKQLL